MTMNLWKIFCHKTPWLKQLKVCKQTLYNAPQSFIKTEYWERKNSDVFLSVKKKMTPLVRKCSLKKIKLKVDFHKNRKWPFIFTPIYIEWFSLDCYVLLSLYSKFDSYITQHFDRYTIPLELALLLHAQVLRRRITDPK